MAVPSATDVVIMRCDRREDRIFCMIFDEKFDRDILMINSDMLDKNLQKFLVIYRCKLFEQQLVQVNLRLISLY